MCRRLIATIAAIALVTVSGCGDWPPIVDSQKDIQALPASEPSVRARGLADRDIPSLSRLGQLRELDFHGGWKVEEAKITDEGLKQLAKLDLPKLETLTFGWSDKITDAGLAYVGQMQNITWLGLPACQGITDAGLPKLLTAQNLTGLDLRGCRYITDDGIQQLAQKKNWKEILLGGCPNVTAAGVARLQAALPNARIDKDDEEWSLRSE
jgi:hypothetical protein